MDLERALSKEGVKRHSTVLSMDKVQLGRSIGQGAFGLVYEATALNGKTVAVKEISKKRVGKKALQNQLALEIAVHRNMLHPNIVHFYDFSHDRENVYFFLEFAPNGDLSDYVEKFKPGETEIAQLMRQVGEAVMFCHSYSVVHRDLKQENILMTKSGVPKLTDFGYCDKVDKDGFCKHELFCGTTDFMAPEMVNEELCGLPLDVWSFGVMVFDLLVGVTPFHARSHKETYERICSADVDWTIPEVRHVKPLLKEIFIVDPFDRITMSELLEYSWFAQ